MYIVKCLLLTESCFTGTRFIDPNLISSIRIENVTGSAKTLHVRVQILRTLNLHNFHLI